MATRGSASASDEFIELYNPASQPVDISGWKLQYKTDTSQDVQTNWGSSGRSVSFATTTTIGAQKFYLVVPDTTAYSAGVTYDLDAGWGTGMSDAGHLRLLNLTGVEVDRVGFGSTANAAEGLNPAVNHGGGANNGSIERNPPSPRSFAAQDTDDNLADFSTRTVRSPHGGSSGAEPDAGRP